jgi:hypothetical protein
MRVRTADELAARTARAVAAAAAAGEDLGLEVTEPRVLYDVFSVIVHLYPSPVVVRVPTVLPPSYSTSPESQTRQQQAELAVAGWLAARNLPVVAPSPLVAREPVRRDGFSMTFWQYVEQVADDEPDLTRRMEMTARLHAALRDYAGDDLGFWVPFGTYIPEGLAALQEHPDLLNPADLGRAQREWAFLEPVLTSRAAFESAFPGVNVQPIHGDAPYHNMITTPHGELWSDFELVTMGAIESDLAMVGPDGIAAYNAAAQRFGLRRVDERVMRVTEAAGRIAMVAALAMAPDLPMLLEGLKPALEMWRAAPEISEI